MRRFAIIVKVLLSLAILAVIAITIGYGYFSRNLPELSKLSDYQPPLVSRIYNTDGELVGEYADEHRILVPFDEIPVQLRNAFLAAEDQQFYEHPGINPARILSAAFANLRAGHTIQGGSTITQQVAKNFLLSSERTYSRKIREVILAHRIEKAFSKDEILYLYLNQIYLGRGAYGVASAAWRYFGKRLDELTLAECAMLAGLPKAPGKYAPHLNHDLALKRRNTVLYLMQQSGFATPDAVVAALKEPLTVVPLSDPKLTDAYADEVYRQLVDRVGVKTLRRQGLTIVVPYKPEDEMAAIHAVRKGDLDLEQRQYYRPPVHHQPEEREKLLAAWSKEREAATAPPAEDETFPALVERVQRNGDLVVSDGLKLWQISKPSWRWEKPSEDSNAPARPSTWQVGDEILLRGDGKGGVQLTQQPSIESALYSVDLKKGTVIARVGGYDFVQGGFDRVSRANRQPGSAFKPFLYATAMEAGMTPASIILDTPVVFENLQMDEFWRPDNYKNSFAGAVTLRNALEHSRNLASIKLLQDIGINRFVRSLNSFPFHRDFPKQLALALGATEVTLEEMAESYIVLASNGQKWKPVSIQQIQDRTGKTIHRSVAGFRCAQCHASPVLAVNSSMQPAEQVIDPVSAFLTTNMMKGVIERGTGIRARALGRPAAGKTGTTNNQVDAWFIGFTPQVITGVWTGRDTPSSMGRWETGSHAALPIWLDAMQNFEKGKPVEDFTPPDGIVWVAIDQKTGKLPGPDTKHILLEAFREGTAPTEESPAASADKTDQEKKSFFELGL